MQENNNSIADIAPITDKDGEVRELSNSDLARFKPIRDVLSLDLLNKLCVEPLAKDVSQINKAPRDKQLKKEPIIEVPQHVIQRFKRTGRGWQNRLKLALDGLLNTHSDDTNKSGHHNSKTS